MRGLILIGGGEHARSVAWAASAVRGGWLRGLLDPTMAERSVALCGVARLGDDAEIPRLRGDHDFVLGIGAVGVSTRRRRVVERALGAGASFVSVVHPSALVAETANIAPGAVVLAGAIVGPGARIGPHAVVNTGAIVEHDCEIEEFAQVAPGAVLGGGVRVEPDAFVGLGARVRDHVRVGARALVGMGAVVVGDVASEWIVVGVPAREREVDRA